MWKVGEGENPAEIFGPTTRKEKNLNEDHHHSQLAQGHRYGSAQENHVSNNKN